MSNEAQASNVVADDDLIDEGLVKYWKKLKKQPKAIVFDLDYTLWPYFVDCHVSPPIFKKVVNKKEKIVDEYDFEIKVYPDVEKILKTLREKCLRDDQYLAIASKSTTHDLAMESLELLGLKKYFSSFQIYPRTKVNHMNAIKDELKLDSFKEILFFDDEHNNIVETKKIGVVPILVQQSTGVDMEIFYKGLEKFNI